MSTVRCFTALELPAVIVDPIETAGRAIRAHDPAWDGEKWVARANLHITLKFFGDVAEDDIAPMSGALGRVYSKTTAPTIPFTGLKPVPTARRASMIWATFADTDGAVGAIAEEIERATRRFGIEPAERAFKAHVTIVRARAQRALHSDALLAAEQAFSSTPEFVSLTRATFLSSTLTRTGPVYERIADWELPAGT